MKEKNRNREIDIAKGIAMWLVVTGHMQIDTINESLVLISACHMPVLFFLSGVFWEKSYNRYSGTELIVKKAKTLLLPYLIWSTISLAMNVIMGGQDMEKVLLEAYDIFINARSLWFLIILFITNLYLLVFRKLIRNDILFYIVCLCGWFVVVLWGPVYLLSFYKWEWLFPYFMVGMIVSRQNLFFVAIENIKLMETRNVCLVAIVALVLYIFFTLQLYGYNPKLFLEYYVNYNLQRHNWLLFSVYYILGFISIYVIILISINVERVSGLLSDIMERIGRYSLDIYLVHMFFVKIFFIAIGSFVLLKELCNQLILAVIGWTIAFLITFVTHNYLKNLKIYRWITGDF